MHTCTQTVVVEVGNVFLPESRGIGRVCDLVLESEEIFTDGTLSVSVKRICVGKIYPCDVVYRNALLVDEIDGDPCLLKLKLGVSYEVELVFVDREQGVCISAKFRRYIFVFYIAKSNVFLNL